jgi:hypothetical protein
VQSQAQKGICSSETLVTTYKTNDTASRPRTPLSVESCSHEERKETFYNVACYYPPYFSDKFVCVLSSVICRTLCIVRTHPYSSHGSNNLHAARRAWDVQSPDVLQQVETEPHVRRGCIVERFVRQRS